MRKIPKPTYVCEDVFQTCIGRVRNPGLRAALAATAPDINAAAAAFDATVTTGTLHGIPRLACGGTGLSVDELTDVYTGRMVPPGSPGRVVYNELLLSAPLDVCPFCGHRIVSELDHYLPKTQYPLLSTSPLNLVPCCSDCNGLKDNKYPRADYQEFIHPYYDAVDDARWLSAEIIRTSPCSFRFFTEPPADWPDLLKRRVDYHFTTLELGKLYTTQAAKETSRIRLALERRFIRGGADVVGEYLQEAFETNENVSMNSWESVYYLTALADDWFCKGGFM